VEGELTLAYLRKKRGDARSEARSTSSKTNTSIFPMSCGKNLTSRRIITLARTLSGERIPECSVLPDLGGHLYTCPTKLGGSRVLCHCFHQEASVGFRGGMGSVRIELNFLFCVPQLVSMSPAISRTHNADGRRPFSVIVGTLTVFTMEWTVEVVLRTPVNAEEERVTLRNRSDVMIVSTGNTTPPRDSSEDSQIVYPMGFAASHVSRSHSLCP